MVFGQDNIETEINIANQTVISVIYGNNFRSFEHRIYINFEHIEKIHGSYVFTNKVENEKMQFLDILKSKTGSAIQINHNDILNSYRKQLQDITNQE
ncbi:18150_t:CDS:2, partial [Racocetra fulgida]